LGDASVGGWEFERLVVPLIVLMAACDTAAIAETHNTPANAWLAQGARAVVATMFPAEAHLTSVVLARIVANASEAVNGDQLLDTWEAVVQRTFLLNQYLDYLYRFRDWRIRRRSSDVPDEIVLEFTYRWNAFKGTNADRHSNCIRILRSALEHFDRGLATSFDDFLARFAVSPHTMFFTQLGWPETIHIKKTRRPPGAEGAISREYWAQRAAGDVNDGPPSV
jgi:hypothetical protein